MTQYVSDIQLGEKCRDKQTGFEGHCAALYFYQHGCERVCLKGMNTNGEIVEFVFDAPEVVPVVAEVKKKAEEVFEPRKTGGPHDRSAPPRR